MMGKRADAISQGLMKLVNRQTPADHQSTIEQSGLKVEPTPAPGPPVPVDAKINSSNARLVCAYAMLLGCDLRQEDVFDVSVSGETPSEAFGFHKVAMALEAAELAVQTLPHGDGNDKPWPALAEMKNGQFTLVLGEDNDHVEIYDLHKKANRCLIPTAEFDEFSTGSVLKASVTTAGTTSRIQVSTSGAHWFWGAFSSSKPLVLEIVLASFVANILAIAIALFALHVYDRVIPHQSQATLWVLTIGAFAAISFEALLRLARARLVDSSGRKIELSVQKLLMDRLLGMRSDLKGRSPNKTFSAMREFGSVREFFTATTIGTLTDIPFIFLFLAIVASIAGPVVWVLIIGAMLMVVPGLFFQKRIMALTQEAQGASVHASRVLYEGIFELDTVKTQSGQARIRRDWSAFCDLGSLKSAQQRRISQGLTQWSQAMQQATYVSAVVAGTYMVFAGHFTVGTIIAVSILTGRTLSPLTQLATTLARWSNVRTALTGLDEVADAPQDVDANRSYLRRPQLKGGYELRDLKYRYEDDGAPVLDINGLHIQSGQTVAVLGANGSGKSTLLKLLSGLYAPDQGKILIDGIGIDQIAPQDLRRSIGYLGQDIRLFAGTLRENLNLSLTESDDSRMLDALHFAGLGPFVSAHHKGLDALIYDGGQGMSVGQRQSIGWARLWLQDPSILLLDEPTSALDQTLENTLVSRLSDWLAGRSTVIATHRVPILQLAQRSIVLQNGRLALEGKSSDVLSQLMKVNQAKVAKAGS